jgi:ATP-dependent Clp protease ATP-binding subunit ClpC
MMSEKTEAATMFEKFSESARRVVFWARAEAGQLGADMIEPEHLLFGFLAEDQGGEFTATQFAGDMAGTIRDTAMHSTPFLSREIAENLRRAILQSSRSGVPVPHGADMRVAETASMALEAAYKRAGGSTVGILHLLWGLITNGGDSVRDLLSSNGVTVEQIEEAIRDRTSPSN